MKKWYDHVLESCIKIIEACKALPNGFREGNIGMNLPGTTGYGLDIYKTDGYLAAVWCNGREWMHGREECHLYECRIKNDGVKFIQKEFSEAEGIALVKATPKLLKWLQAAAKSYEMNEEG